MNLCACAAAALAMVAALSSPAKADSFSPTNITWTMKGKVVVNQLVNFQCNWTLSGIVDAAGVGHVTGSTFTSGTPTCGMIVSTNLPWTFTAGPGASLGMIRAVTITTPVGTCGPGDVPVSIGPAGAVSINAVMLPPNCKLSATLTITPAIVIVP